MIKISVVCATHNKIDILLDTIATLIPSANLINEIIICSTNNEDFNKIKEKFDNIFFFVFIFSKIKSQTYQRSLAINKVSSNLLLQIDDDVIIYPNTIKQMISYFKNENEKIIVGAYLIYPNEDHVSKRFTNSYNKNIFLKFIYLFLNFFKKPEQMSVISSGRIFPLMNNSNSHKEWLSSFLMYNKNTYYLSKVHFNNGKGYYEDIIFTHKLYNLGFKLIMAKEAIVKIDYNNPTNLFTYFSSLPMQFHFVKLFKKNYFLFILDVFIFTFIHLLITIKSKI